MFRHTDGYSDEDAWIYETKPNRMYLLRLGFDTVGGEVSMTWMQKFRPEPQFWQAHRALDWGIATNWWLSGLPTIVDFTCARWSHGALQPIEGREPSPVAVPPGGAGHFMPYSIITDEGRALYAEHIGDRLHIEKRSDYDYAPTRARRTLERVRIVGLPFGDRAR